MTSQLLFGEIAEVLKNGTKWVQIKVLHDGFVGFVDRKQVIDLKGDSVDKGDYALSLELVYNSFSDENSLMIPFAARLPKFDGINFYLTEQKYTFSGSSLIPKSIKPSFSLLEKLARKLLNVPYLLGGRSVLGIDAAGFVQLLFSFFGYSLYRDFAGQLTNGERIDFFQQARSGDVFYFENKKGIIDHAGIYFGDNTLIHVYGKVKLDKVDNFGIYNKEKKRYTHKLRSIQRFIPFEVANSLISFDLQATKVPVDKNQQLLF